MNKHNYWDRFKHISKYDWAIIGFMTFMVILGLYMSISFSIKISEGYTLFGDSSNYAGKYETGGPYQADYHVLILYWVLSALLLLLDIYYIFIKKPKKENLVKKTIVDGKTVIYTEDDKENGKDNHERK